MLSFSPTGAFLGATRAASDSDYGKLFPSLVGTYRFTDRILLRGGVTRSIARPDYGDLNPRRSINDDSDRISEGNPGLKPLMATNLDLSFEWYLKSAGSFTVGVFHKDIENFSYTLRKGWNVYAEGKNLTDEVTRRIYMGRTDRPTEHEFPGWSIVGGVKFEF